MNRDQLEAALWRTWPESTPAQIDAALAAADAYWHWRKPPPDAAYPKHADPDAAAHRAVLAAIGNRKRMTPADDGAEGPSYEWRREFLDWAGGAA